MQKSQTAAKKKGAGGSSSSSRQKKMTASYEDILVVLEQARSDGQQIGRGHRNLNVRFERPEMVEHCAQVYAEKAWMKIQRSIPVLHYAWTSQKPLFLNTYTAGFLQGYSQEHSRAYELFKFPDTADLGTAYSSKRRARKQLKRLQQAA